MGENTTNCRRCRGTGSVQVADRTVLRCPRCEGTGKVASTALGAIEFNTREYEFSLGHKPRGIGAWAFAFRRDADLSEIFWINGSYGDAKKVARAKARAEGHNEVWVCS